MNIKICKLHPNATVPTYAHDTDACFDLYALTVDNAHTIGANLYHCNPVECGTGLAFEVPPGWAMLIFSRSGHGFNFDTRLANCVGCIDSDYRGEIKVKLTCDVERDEGMPMSVMPGDRIAQACILPIPRVSFEFVDELGETARGKGGFGSTGR